MLSEYCNLSGTTRVMGKVNLLLDAEYHLRRWKKDKVKGCCQPISNQILARENKITPVIVEKKERTAN